MSVTLLEVLAAAQTRRASLVGEMAGYLVLGLADQVVGAPRRVGPDEVVLGEDGSVRISGGIACRPSASKMSASSAHARLSSP